MVEAWGLSFAFAKALHDDFVSIACRSSRHDSRTEVLIPDFPDTLHQEDGGGMGIRTPDILLAKQTLYQLSYTPALRRQSR